MSQCKTIEAESVAYLYAQAKATPYIHYPDFPKRLQAEQIGFHNSPLELPTGTWWVNPSDDHALTPTDVATLRAKGVTSFDGDNRPLHPWLESMRSYPDFGFVCGKGAYREWGPNPTADPIVIRHDLDEPHILLIQRADTLAWALPGGFVDPGEDPIVAALRETNEETGVDISSCQDQAQITYQGPVADPRTTIHAWPETTAVRIDIPDEWATTLPRGSWQGSDDARMAAWVPLSELGVRLFGSHRALIQMALDA